MDRLGADLKVPIGEALQKSKEYVDEQAHAAMKKHHRTGKTESTILDSASVEWEGHLASIKVGFDISGGGLPSIFLMYGTPRMAKDSKLYNAVYGPKTKREVKEIQEKIFQEALHRAMGG